ncbi:hypothetical protein L6164_020069 [Bauhinia variegata]|uniref:Uncharacterized protein n=1 Tax=Bauhinia variegata TaxID=167791 RepID=A0ACB9MVH6_BAUVA|nr:hypothetical protein L6164_020069 [Bauhinia variegata]
MFKSASTRGGALRYERLGEEIATIPLNEEFKRSTSVPTSASANGRAFSSSVRKPALGSNFPDTMQRNPTKKASKEKPHPLFSFMDFRRKKKTTAKPEFSRYLEYLKEGGMWDSNSNKPVIYYE